MTIPEGAVGPKEIVPVELGLGISQLLGASTCRIHTDAERFFPVEGVEGSIVFTIESDVVEGAEPDDLAVHVRQEADDPEGYGDLEYVSVDDQLFVRQGESGWEDATGSDMLGLGPNPFPILYSTLHNASFRIGSAEWLGNEDINSIPVGRYQWPRPDDDSIGPHDVVAEGEFWIDASGVVWRVRTSSYQYDMLLFTQDSKLLNVRAHVTIETPETP